MGNRYRSDDRDEDHGGVVLAWVALFMILFALGFIAAGIYYL